MIMSDRVVDSMVDGRHMFARIEQFDRVGHVSVWLAGAYTVEHECTVTSPDAYSVMVLVSNGVGHDAPPAQLAVLRTAGRVFAHAKYDPT